MENMKEKKSGLTLGEIGLGKDHAKLAEQKKAIIEERKQEPEIDLNELRAEMLTEVKEGISELFIKFRKDVDLRNVFIGVFTHEVSKYCDLKLEDEETGTFIGRHMQAYIKLKELKRLGLIRFLRIIEISEKRMKGEKLDLTEKQALAKWKAWDKTLTKKGHDCFYPKINYYATTEKGQDPKFLKFLANVRKEKPAL